MRRTCRRLLVVSLLAAVAAQPVDGAPPPCHSHVSNAVIPPWARDGFTDKAPRAPYVLGRGGGIVAILFGATLHAPPAADRNNKILWVSRFPINAPSPLRVSAQRMQAGTAIGPAVKRFVDGAPGPSTIDLPARGCWRFSLRWGSHRDTMDLRYQAP